MSDILGCHIAFCGPRHFAVRQEDQRASRSQGSGALLGTCWVAGELAETYQTDTPGGIIKFVPAGCTSKCLPCDLTVHKAAKHKMRMACTAYVQEIFHLQLASGVPAAERKLDVRSALKDPSNSFVQPGLQSIKKNPPITLHCITNWI